MASAVYRAVYDRLNKVAEQNEKAGGNGNSGGYVSGGREDWIRNQMGGKTEADFAQDAPDKVAAPSLGPLVDNGGTATHQSTPPPAAAPPPTSGPAPPPAPAPPPTSGPAPPPAPAPPPTPPPTPQGAASPMASLQAAADPGAGWAQSTAQSQLRPGLGAASLSPMQRLFSGRAY